MVNLITKLQIWKQEFWINSTNGNTDFKLKSVYNTMLSLIWKYWKKTFSIGYGRHSYVHGKRRCYRKNMERILGGEKESIDW